MKTIAEYDQEIQQNPNDAELYRDRGNAYTKSREKCLYIQEPQQGIFI